MNKNISKETIRAEYAKVWEGNDKMINYCTNEVQNAGELEDGTLFVIGKQKIETRFCFGESGYDYDEALDGARTARTSTDYLKRENMRSYDETLEQIAEAEKLDGNYIAVVFPKVHYNQPAACRLGSVQFRRTVDVLQDLGGSAYLERLPGQKIVARWGGEYRVLTAPELQTVRETYEAARAAHEKKVDAYIKRYGTSKVHSWTYWRDA